MSKPRLLVLGQPKYSGPELEAFRVKGDISGLDIVSVTTRSETVSKLKQLASEFKYTGMIIMHQTLAIKPYDKKLFEFFVPELKFVTCHGAGFDFGRLLSH